MPNCESPRNGLSAETAKAFPGVLRSCAPCITHINLSVVGSGPMCAPGYSPSSKYLWKIQQWRHQHFASSSISCERAEQAGCRLEREAGSCWHARAGGWPLRYHTNFPSTFSTGGSARTRTRDFNVSVRYITRLMNVDLPTEYCPKSITCGLASNSASLDVQGKRGCGNYER